MAMDGQRLTVSISDAFFVFDVDHVEEKRTEQGVAALDRRTGKLGTQYQMIPCPEGYTVECIMGVIRLLAGPYMVFVTKSAIVGTLFGAKIEQVVKVALVPISRRQLDSTESKTEQKYIELVTNLLTDGSFYFSHNLDLSRNCQARESAAVPGDHESFSWSKPMRERFFSLIRAESLPAGPKRILRWCATVIRGFVALDPEFIKGKAVEYALISRLGHDRVGRRYTKRGADKNGHVANHVETEQILFDSKSGHVTSYVQVRGSIPVLWSQKTNLAWNPPIVLKNGSNGHNSALKSHFNQQLVEYERESVVSLIKKSGSEATLGTAFERFINLGKDKRLVYIAFDLQKEVGHSKFENLKKLFDATDSNLEAYAFFSKRSEAAAAEKKQSGIMRTNCKDNLDRTNLVQTRFAMKMGLRQLATVLGISEESLGQEIRTEAETKMRLMWADNGDRVSVMYAGTPAIRGDHTRTGKTKYELMTYLATIKGLVNDGVNALSRFYINNFEDGENQDALDILLEKRPLPSSYKIDPKARSFKKMDKVRTMLTNFFVFIFTLIRPPNRRGANLLWAFAWMALVWIVFTLFRLDTQRIVNVPILKWNHVKGKSANSSSLDGESGNKDEKGKEKEVDLSKLTEDDLKDE